MTLPQVPASSPMTRHHRGTTTTQLQHQPGARASDAEEFMTSAEEFTRGFGTTTTGLLAPLVEKMGALDPLAQKRLDRAKMLHIAISSKLPAVKLDDLVKMSVEWIHGMLEATFPLESSCSDADCKDTATLGQLLEALDGAHTLACSLAALFRKAGRLKEPPPRDAGGGSATGAGEQAGGSSHEPANTRPSSAHVADILHGAIAAADGWAKGKL